MIKNGRCRIILALKGDNSVLVLTIHISDAVGA